MFVRQVCRKIHCDVKAKLQLHFQRAKRSHCSRHARHVSSKIYLQVIGTPCPDTAPSLLLFTDSERYLFNCGENFAQLVHYLDLSYDASKIFLTGRQWRHIGGLVGLHFLPQTIEPSGIEIFGPEGIADYMKSTEIFAKRASVPECLITCTEYSHNKWNVYKDRNITITPVLYPTQGQSDEENCVCYICEIAELRGSFIPEKAEELKIPYGRWRNELHCGKTVVLPDGRTIHPHQVVTPPEAGPLFAIISCTSTSSLNSLLNSNAFSNHWYNKSFPKKFELIVHMTSQEIFECPKYLDWISKFGPYTSHIILNESTAACQSSFNLRNTLDANLCGIDTGLFPIPLEKPKPSKDIQNFPTKCIEGKKGMKYYFFPKSKKGLCLDNVYKPIFRRQLTHSKEFMQHSVFSGLNDDQIISFYNTQVTFLGTAASKQSKLRGTSCILVELSAESCFMLDCGDGTNYQLQRHYGDDTDRIISSLLFVFISHIHIDHHMGLVNLILNRMKLTKQGKASSKLTIIGPESLCYWLQNYSSLMSTKLDYRYYTFTDIKSGKLKTEIKALMISAELKKLSLVPVNHCYDSFGIVLVHSSRWKLVYSGDCTPTKKLWTEGKDATLLIHEATFLSDYKKSDLVKHSTVDQAIEVSKKMQAHYTILTHFSQRYSLSDLLKTPLPRNVNLAFDHMSVRLLELPHLDKRQSKIRRILTKKTDYNN